MKQSVLVYFTTRKVTDPVVCQNEFWRAEFGWKICDDKELPEIQYARWEENSD